MSEDLHVAREIAEELFPGVELSDDEVVRIAFTATKWYRMGVESERARAEAEALKYAAKKSSTIRKSRARKG